ncbi:MAG: hypothetical protein MI923_02605 [Phycisphaerales bacterium]|nr:hypothetical protein [Phycisphaerales bacterium]
MTSNTIKIRWRKFKTAMVVTLITLLIWYAADMNVSETTPFSIQIRLTSADPDRYAGLVTEGPYEQTITVDLKGRRRRLRDFRDLLEKTGVVTIEIDRSQPTSVEPQELSTIDDVLPRMKELQESWLNIDNATPKTLKARIDEIETRVLPIKEDFGNLEVSAPHLSHQNITVRMPRFAWAMLGDEPVVLDNAEGIIRDAVARADGDSFEEDVPLTMGLMNDLKLDADMVEFQPSEVRVTGRIRATRVTKSKGPIQIKWYIPNEVQKEYVVETEQELRMNIDVKGPENRIEQLNAADIRGWVEVFAGDVDDPGPGKEITRKVEFRLPTEFSDCIPVLEPHPEIRFRLEPSTGNSTTSSQG